jgi:hypothetical protein
VWLLADAGLRRRYRATLSGVLLLKQVATMAGGVLLIVGPVLGAAIARAGVHAVWYALVIFPLFNYRNQMDCPWGDVNMMTAGNARFTLPFVLKYLPVVLLVSAGRLLWLWHRRRDLLTAQRLVLLLIFCGTSALSIAYFPDFIKISFIAFAFLVAAAEVFQWGADSIRVPSRLARGLGGLAAAILLIASARHLYGNLILLRSQFPFSHSTAFGRVDFPREDETRLHDALVVLLADTPTRDLYAYPMMSDLYLTVPAHNPTPYGFFLAFGYHSAEEVQRVLDALEDRKLPYIVLIPGFLTANDPILRYVVQKYEPVSPMPLAGRVIYRRKRGA